MRHETLNQPNFDRALLWLGLAVPALSLLFPIVLPVRAGSQDGSLVLPVFRTRMAGHPGQLQKAACNKSKT
jgi:hypothetical protein